MLLEYKIGEDRFWEQKSKEFKHLARKEISKAWRRLNRGLSIEDIYKEIKRFQEAGHYLKIVDTLEHCYIGEIVD